MNTDALLAFEEEFHACVAEIVDELEKDKKYEVKTKIDEFMQPYKEVSCWKWSRA